MARREGRGTSVPSSIPVEVNYFPAENLGRYRAVHLTELSSDFQKKDFTKSEAEVARTGGPNITSPGGYKKITGNSFCLKNRVVDLP